MRRFLPGVIFVLILLGMLTFFMTTKEIEQLGIDKKNQSVVLEEVVEIQTGTMVETALDDLVKTDVKLEVKWTAQQIITAIKCQNIPRTESALTERINQALADDDLPEMIESLQRKYDACKDSEVFTIEMIASLMQHAEAGDETATLKLWRLNHRILHQFWDMGKPTRDEYVARKHQFDLARFRLAQQHAAKGSELAMLLLVRGYYNEDPEQAIVGGQNYVKSLAYAELVIHLTDNDKHYAQAQWFSRELRRKMTDDEVQKAIDLFDELLSN